MRFRARMRIQTLLKLLLSLVFWTTARRSHAAPSVPVVTTITAFNGLNGANPNSGLVLGNDGEFYGTTPGGGAQNAGTIFRWNTNGTLTTLASFSNTNGFIPVGQLAEDVQGDFWGMTQMGGAFNSGTIFSVTPGGQLIHRFSFNGTNGGFPSAGLVFAADGNLYGTTSFGGTAGRGTVFRFTTNGILTTLASFMVSNGSIPNAPLVQATDGLLYGTTLYGGSDGRTYGNGQAGGGTVFRISTNGNFVLLTSFYGTNGAQPSAQLVPGANGLLYGTTIAGGASENNFISFIGYGTIFQISAAGELSTLVSFDGVNGAAPRAGLTSDSHGNLYGTTSMGGNGFSANYWASGATGGGTIFQLTTNKEFNSIASMRRRFIANSLSDEGISPESSLTFDGYGNLFGTASRGVSASSALGTIFQIQMLEVPILKPIAATNGMFGFSWNVTAKQFYQVEWSSDPSTTNWHELGNAIWATNTAPLSIFQSIDQPQRYYRAVMLR